MGKSRLEAFGDGVIAILITIMVLEMKVPHGEDLHALLPIIPVFLSYVLSFIYLGIYWNNHHHMLHTCKKITVPFCGPTCTCCSGYHSFLSPLAGWVKIILPRRQQRCMAWYC